MKIWYGIFALSISILGLTLALFFVNNYFYPMSYKYEILEVSSSHNVDAALIASVINVESGFDKAARSNKGAIGLMQLMPSTAEWICKLRGVEYEESKLLEPQFNIKVGTMYLNYLIAQFDSVENAILAYNAGYGNVKAWLANSEISDGKTVTTIPFEETRYYIIKINKNLHYYKKKYK